MYCVVYCRFSPPLTEHELSRLRDTVREHQTNQKRNGRYPRAEPTPNRRRPIAVAHPNTPQPKQARGRPRYNSPATTAAAANTTLTNLSSCSEDMVNLIEDSFDEDDDTRAGALVVVTTADAPIDGNPLPASDETESASASAPAPPSTEASAPFEGPVNAFTGSTTRGRGNRLADNNAPRADAAGSSQMPADGGQVCETADYNSANEWLTTHNKQKRRRRQEPESCSGEAQGTTPAANTSTSSSLPFSTVLADAIVSSAPRPLPTASATAHANRRHTSASRSPVPQRSSAQVHLSPSPMRGSGSGSGAQSTASAACPPSYSLSSGQWQPSTLLNSSMSSYRTPDSSQSALTFASQCSSAGTGTCTSSQSLSQSSCSVSPHRPVRPLRPLRPLLPLPSSVVSGSANSSAPTGPRHLQQQQAPIINSTSASVQQTLASIGQRVLPTATASHHEPLFDSQSSVDSSSESMKLLLMGLGLTESDLAQLDGLKIDSNYFLKVCPSIYCNVVILIENIHFIILCQETPEEYKLVK